MRIVGGRLKGRVLQGPGSTAIRPTSDRLRETLFNILAHSYDNPVEGASTLDMFAGTGALGIEALSRGARFGLFVDASSAACAIVRANAEALGLAESARIFRRDARKLGAAPEHGTFDLVFLDPPYGKGFVPPALKALRDGGWLSQDALLVIEEAAEAGIDVPGRFCRARKTALRRHAASVRFIPLTPRACRVARGVVLICFIRVKMFRASALC